MPQSWLFDDDRQHVSPPEKSNRPNFTPRDYQRNAIDRIEFELGLCGRNHAPVNSTLLYLATGLGKTECFVEVARRNHEKLGRTMIVAPTKDLVHQTAKKVADRIGMWPAIEQGDRWSNEVDERKKIVVACRDSLHARRIRRLKGFGLVVLDEAHHYSWENTSTQVILQHFLQQNQQCKFLGATATPQRGDDSALERVFKSVAYTMGIKEGVDQGYLIRPQIAICQIKSLDLGFLRPGKADFTSKSLAATMNRDAMNEIIDCAVREGADRMKTLYFAVSVDHAEYMANKLTSIGIPTTWVCGDLKRVTKEERAERLDGFKKGKYRGIVNVAVLTEGWDAPGLVDPETGETIDPGVEHIFMAQPTMSIARYTQMLGRGTRPIPGTVDLGPGSTSQNRKDSIALSAKPVVYVTDIVDASLNHRLVTAADALAGTWYTQDVIDLANKELREKHDREDWEEILKRAQRQVDREHERQRQEAEAARHREEALAKAVYDRFEVDAFDFTGQRYDGERRPEPVTQMQFDQLTKVGFTNPERLTRQEARVVFAELTRGKSVGEIERNFNTFLEQKNKPKAPSIDEINALLLEARR